MFMQRLFSIFIIVFALTLFGTAGVYAERLSVPKPQKNPFSSGWGRQVMELGVENPEARKQLLTIPDARVKQNILSAKSGSCPAVGTSAHSKVKVENAKQCGKTPEEKKKKNGKKCTATGIQGGSIDAMCINGCCVALNIIPDKNSNLAPFQNNILHNNGTGAQYLPSSKTAGLISSFMNVFRGVMGGGGSGNQFTNNYGNPYIITPQPIKPTSSVFAPEPTAAVHSTDTTAKPVNTESDSSLVGTVDNSSVVSSTTETHRDTTTKNQDGIQTIISKNGVKVEVKVDKVEQVDRYAFAQPKLVQPVVVPPEQGSYNEVENDNINILRREKSIKVHKNESAVSHTGFQGEKVARPAPSLIEKISIWLATLFGIN